MNNFFLALYLSAIEARSGEMPAHVMRCPQCDLENHIPELFPDQTAHCSRCEEDLYTITAAPFSSPITAAASALFFLILSCCFPFLSMDVQGNVSQIYLIQNAQALFTQGFAILSYLLLIFIILAPALYVCLIIYLHSGLLHHKLLPGMTQMTKLLQHLKPWIMVDVFMLAVLVSMVKMVSYGDLYLGWAFWAFTGMVLTLTYTGSLVNTHWLHYHILRLKGINPLEKKIEHSVGCTTCGFLSPEGRPICPYCKSRLHKRRPNSLQMSIAFLISAIVCYVPANIYPIMITNVLGEQTDSNILQGVILLWNLGSYPVAMVILIASVCIPIAKIISLCMLCLATRYIKNEKGKRFTQLYRVTEFIGRWSMVDVFVVSILVALVQMGNLMSIFPGHAAIPFAAVVILTMFSAMNFDPRLIWDKQLSKKNPSEEEKYDS